MQGSTVRFQQELDQHIKNEYHEICFNPNKRHILQRLISIPTTPSQPSQPTEHSENSTNLNNMMLREYMNSIYEHYGIEDPIKRQFRLAKRSLDLPSGHSPEKSLNLTMVTESDRLTNTKRKLISLKDSFKRDNSDIIFSSQLNNQDISVRQSNSPVNRSRMGRQIGYRTKEKIYFKKQPREQGIKHISRPIVRHQFVIEENGQQKVVIKFNNNNNSKCVQESKKEVPVVFRYCPMCEQSVLDCNIEYHENVCKEIQRAYKMTYIQIENIIQQKIKRLELEISKQFLQKDQKTIENQFSNLKELVAYWMDTAHSHSLEKVKTQFSHFACSTYEKINKLNWFKRLYKTVAKKRSLEKAFR